MKIVSIMWSSYVNMLVRASKNTDDILQLSAYSSKALEQNPEKLDAALQEAANADIIFLYRSSEQFWESIEKRVKELGKNIPIVCCGHDPSYWTLSTVQLDVIAMVNSYIIINGEENFTNMLRYIAREVGGLDIKAEERNYPLYLKKTLSDKKYDLEKLYEISKQNERIAITCFERDVAYCHRGVVAKKMQNLFGVDVRHL